MNYKMLTVVLLVSIQGTQASNPGGDFPPSPSPSDPNSNAALAERIGLLEQRYLTLMDQYIEQGEVIQVLGQRETVTVEEMVHALTMAAEHLDPESTAYVVQQDTYQTVQTALMQGVRFLDSLQVHRDEGRQPFADYSVDNSPFTSTNSENGNQSTPPAIIHGFNGLTVGGNSSSDFEDYTDV